MKANVYLQGYNRSEDKSGNLLSTGHVNGLVVIRFDENQTQESFEEWIMSRDSNPYVFDVEEGNKKMLFRQAIVYIEIS